MEKPKNWSELPFYKKIQLYSTQLTERAIPSMWIK